MIKKELERYITFLNQCDEDEDLFDNLYNELNEFCQNFNFINQYKSLTFDFLLKIIPGERLDFQEILEENHTIMDFLTTCMSKHQYEELLPILIETHLMPEPSSYGYRDFYKKLIKLFESGPHNVRGMIATALDQSFSEASSGDFYQWDSFQPLFLFSFFYGDSDKYYYPYFFNCGANALHENDSFYSLTRRYFGKPSYEMLFANEYLKGCSDQKKMEVLKKLRDYYISVYLLDGDNLITEYDGGGINEEFFCRIIADLKQDNPSLFENVASAMLTTYESEGLVNMLNKAFLESTQINREITSTNNSFTRNNRYNSQRRNPTYKSSNRSVSNSNRSNNASIGSSGNKKNNRRNTTNNQRGNFINKKNLIDRVGFGLSILSGLQKNMHNKRKK